ncbi:MAG: hypothetical protein K2Y05_12885 [Hyphomicrobiaceae bacterium]|nr:hypothetical protein [Hyphomicrobiaceae bacterium]
MAKASPLSQQIMKVLQSEGKAVTTGPALYDVLGAVKAAGKLGRPQSAPRLAVRSRFSRPGLMEKNSHVLVIRDGNRPPVTTGIVIRPGMELCDIELAGKIALDDHMIKANDAFLEENSNVDVSVKTILNRWIDRHEGTASKMDTQRRRADRDSLLSFFVENRLGDLEYESGLAYIDHHIADAADAEKRRTMTNSAIKHLKMLRKAIDFFYESLSKKPDERRHFLIPKVKKQRSEIFLTWDQFNRLLKATQGWEWDSAQNCWKPDLMFEADLAIVERYLLIYFYSGTRDRTIVPLEWGVGLDAGSIDARKGIIYRSAPGADETNKRKEPSHLLGTLRKKVVEWEQADLILQTPYVIHDAAGEAIHSMTGRFERVCRKAGLEWVNKHVLKHTGTVLLSHAGLDLTSLAVAHNTKEQTLQDEYRHLQFLWVKARTSSQRNLKLDLDDLRKTSPESNDAWKARAARLAARRAAKAAKNAKDANQ